MWSRACQSKVNRTVPSMSATAWMQTCTMPHWYAMCRTQEMGANRTKWYLGGMLLVHFPQKRLNACKRTTLARYAVEQHSTVRYTSKVLQCSLIVLGDLCSLANKEQLCMCHLANKAHPLQGKSRIGPILYLQRNMVPALTTITRARH